jgi:hypothetical protein
MSEQKLINFNDEEGHGTTIIRRDCLVEFYKFGEKQCTIKNTGNGFIAEFHPLNSVSQSHYVEFDYSQIVYFIYAMSMFKKELGFKE